MISAILALHFLIVSAGPEQLDLRLMQGTWIVKKAIVEGKNEPELVGAVVVVSDNTIRALDPKGTPGPVWHLRLCTSKRPKELLAFDTQGRLIIRAAYDLRPGELILIYPYQQPLRLVMLPIADKQNLPTILSLVRPGKLRN